MSETFKLQYNNNTLTYPGWNGYVCYEKPSGYPITYLSDEHVSVTGDDLYLPGSEGLQLQSSYDPYYRIDYEITNGEIVDGLLVPSGPCTVYAKDKINYFTATGNFEKGSDVATRPNSTGATAVNVSEKYALYVEHTGDIPSSWYANYNRWNPSNASSYYITLNPKMTLTLFEAARGTASTAIGVSLIGSTQSNSQTFVSNFNSTNNVYYNKTITTTTHTTYGVSARLLGKGASNPSYHSYAKYVANGTTGTWAATGIAP